MNDINIFEVRPYIVSRKILDYHSEKFAGVKKISVNISDFVKWYNTSSILHPKIKWTESLEIDVLKELPDFEIIEGIFKRKDYKPVEIKFECLSGKIIVNDYLRNLPEKFKNKFPTYNINFTSGQIETLEKYSEEKILHGYIGNSCAGLYLDRESNNLEIGTVYEKLNDDDLYNEPGPINKKLEKVGFVCTDLWWYTIMDLDEYKKVGGATDDSATIIEIESGSYMLTHYYGITMHHHGNGCYATLKKV